MAAQLIDSLTTKFKPEKYHDTYREAVQELIEKKAEGEDIVTQPEVTEKKGRATNLMAALEASLATAKSAAGGKNGHAHHVAAGARSPAAERARDKRSEPQMKTNVHE
jgi:DNA end-binding protein Ku